jgi:hypothetical protein
MQGSFAKRKVLIPTRVSNLIFGLINMVKQLKKYIDGQEVSKQTLPANMDGMKVAADGTVVLKPDAGDHDLEPLLEHLEVPLEPGRKYKVDDYFIEIEE